MKILFILESFYPNIGGAEKLFNTLAAELVRSNHTVTVLTCKSNNSLLNQEYSNIRIVRTPSKSRYFFSFLAFFYALPLIRKMDIVHTTSYTAALPAFLVAKLFNKKVVVTFHEVFGDDWFKVPFLIKIKAFIFYLYEKFLLSLWFDKFIAVSKHTQKQLQISGIKDNRINLIYNGINYTEFFPKKVSSSMEGTCNDPFLITYFGRLGVSKGIDILVKAIITFFKRNPNSKVKFKLIIPKGNNTIYNWLMTKLVYHINNKNVIVIDSVNKQQLFSELIKSSCVIIPSWSEGFCFAAVEANALNIPIISSNQAALKETVMGKCILVSNYTINDFVDAINKAIACDWQEVDEKKFTLNESCLQYINLYKKMLNPHI